MTNTNENKPKRHKALTYVLTSLFAVVTSAMLCITSFASSATSGTSLPYLPSQNVANVQTQLFKHNSGGYVEYYGTVSYAQPSVTYDSHGIPSLTTSAITYGTLDNGTIPTTLKSTYSSERLFSEFLTEGRARFANPNKAWYGGTTTITFTDIVFDPSLVQGEIRANLDMQYLESLMEEYSSDLPYATSTFTYKGSVLYPLLKGGSTSLDFTYNVSFSYTALGGAPHIRVSIIPCETFGYTTYDTMTSEQIYGIVYDNLSEEVQATLVPPASLADYPVCFTEYNVVMDNQFHTTNNPFDAPLGLNSVFYSLPATQGGFARDGETLDDLYTINNRPVDIMDFDFFDWIWTVIVGVLTVEILPGLYLGYPLVVFVGVAVVHWVLKVFLGG